MEKGSLGVKFTDRTNPMDKQFELMVDAARLRRRRRRRRSSSATPAASTWSATAPRAEQFAKIGYKNHKHSVNNPYSQFQDEYTLEQILNAPMVYEPLTKLQCCPTSDGAGAAILASEDFVKKHDLQDQAVEIAGMAMTTDFAEHASTRRAASSWSAPT